MNDVDANIADSALPPQAGIWHKSRALIRHASIFLKLIISLWAGISALRANVSTPIHATAKAPNGASDQITNLGSGNLTATPTRDGAGRINGYIWSDGTNTVTQTWTRGAGGRIESAGSDVSGAPSFVYLLDSEKPEQSFDGSGRRLKCTTAGGTWTYVYGAGGQLTSATHPTLGTFTYAFDGIGRRTEKGEANTTDVLNRTTAWTHSQNKTLTVKAHPDARMWFNGVEIENFSGTHSAAITPPGTDGGWVPWETLSILEGAGDGTGNPPANPLANPDAKAEKKGAVWVPPTAETLTYDAAGNRESSAQWDYGWDAKNQLARARTKNHTTAAQGWDITYTYDSEGRRTGKHVIEYINGTQVSEKIITFVWDGWDLLYERHQLPSGLTLLERKYLWGPDIADGQAGGAGGLLLIRETKGTSTTEIIPLYDGTGHVIALTNFNKDLLASHAYGPFGENISAVGPRANSNPWRWATKYLDEETGLYYFGKRYYDPITGQWLSREILGESESINLYAYCHNDPINNVDVLGLSAYHFYEGGWVLEMFEKAVMGKASEYHDYVEGNKNLISAGLGTQSVGPLDILQDGSANLVGSIVGLANDAGTQAAYAQSAHRNDGGGEMASLGYGISQFVGTLSGAQMIAQGGDGRAMSWMPDGDLQVTNLSSDESQQFMTFGTLQLVGNASMFSYFGKSAYRFKTEGLILRSASSGGINSLVAGVGSTAVKLNRHQQGLLSTFKGMTPGQYIELPKMLLRIGDMIKVSQVLNVELAHFTKGGTRRLMLGRHKSVPFTPGMGKKWAKQGWRWSGHTHPHGGGIPLEPSLGVNYDTGVLWRFSQYGGQRHSGIWDWDGNSIKFTPDPNPPFTTLPWGGY